MNPSPRLWTSDEFAQFAQLSPDYVRRMRVEGTGPGYVKIGRAVRYVPGVVTRWIEANIVTTTEDRKS